jgi:hypothetical protein
VRVERPAEVCGREEEDRSLLCTGRNRFPIDDGKRGVHAAYTRRSGGVLAAFWRRMPSDQGVNAELDLQTSRSDPLVSSRHQIGFMEHVTSEQILALGSIGIAVIGAAVLFSFAIMAGTLKLSISWIGNRTPSFLSCCGWLLAISFVNCFFVYGTLIVFSPTALLLVTPLTWFVTLYMIATAADCGLIRAFGIWITNSVLSTIGIVALFFVCTIPLAIMGAGVETASDSVENKFNNAEAMASDAKSPAATHVKFREVPFDDSTDQDDPVSAPMETSGIPAKSKAVSELGKTSRDTSVRPKGQPIRIRRAADGSKVNPFFQD